MKTTTISSQVLVIGYGNTLRGDDGVGYQVAETLAEWQISRVRSLAVHQLLPELAADIAAVDVVVFVDAAVAMRQGRSCVNTPPTPNITITPLIVGGETPLRTHLVTPQLLLGLAQHLYGVTPAAYLLAIPAIDFALGTSLSPIARTGQELALDYLKCWLSNPTPELCTK